MVVVGVVASTSRSIKRACDEFKEAKVVEYSEDVVITDSGSVGLMDEKKLDLGSSRAHSHSW